MAKKLNKKQAAAILFQSFNLPFAVLKDLGPVAFPTKDGTFSGTNGTIVTISGGKISPSTIEDPTEMFNPADPETWHELEVAAQGADRRRGGGNGGNWWKFGPGEEPRGDSWNPDPEQD